MHSALTASQAAMMNHGEPAAGSRWRKEWLCGLQKNAGSHSITCIGHRKGIVWSECLFWCKQNRTGTGPYFIYNRLILKYVLKCTHLYILKQPDAGYILYLNYSKSFQQTSNFIHCNCCYQQKRQRKHVYKYGVKNIYTSSIEHFGQMPHQTELMFHFY